MLLHSGEFSSALYEALGRCERKLVIFSAFVKTDALRYLSEIARINDDIDVLVVARWQKKDLLAGASDKDVYEICKEKGWLFGVSMQMHGKLFSIDDEDIFLGSANLTRRGLQIGLIGNHEFGTKIPAGSADIDKLEKFIQSEVRIIDDGLYRRICEELEFSQKDEVDILCAAWSEQIMKDVDRPVSYLWVNELPKTTPKKILSLNINDESVVNDCELLGLNFDSVSEEELKRCFKMSRAYRWLFDKLRAEGKMHFGGVTSALHEALLDDPKPYRVEVKDCVVNLYAWATFVDDVFEVTQPRHSELIRLK